MSDPSFWRLVLGLIDEKKLVDKSLLNIFKMATPGTHYKHTSISEIFIGFFQHFFTYFFDFSLNIWL